jgi:type IV secretory pathway TrbF-like protein
MVTKKKTGNKKPVSRGKLTPQIEADIVELIKAGNYVDHACSTVGIHKSTYYDWLAKAKASTRYNKYVRFSDAVEKAQGWSIARDVAIITKASEKYWQAAAWKLERKHPDRFGRQRVDVQVTGKIDATVTHITKSDQEVIREALGLVAQSAKQEIECEDEVDFV